MKKMKFYKFDGAGNDFVVVDNRIDCRSFSEEELALLCHRRFGVGADGFMTLGKAANGYDFEMTYYNSDGRVGSMCGNGGRCIAAFAYLLGLGDKLNFLGYDGPHKAEILSWNPDSRKGIVKLAMRNVSATEVRPCLDGCFLDTGSPHYVQPVVGLEHFDVIGEGRRIREMKDIFPNGTNVDFIEELPDGRLAVRTYERGVEDETWACGTGVTACAIVSGKHDLVTRGGNFSVIFNKNKTAFENVQLIGPVSLNFIGEWTFSAK
jgi:diaminopimelate epimerase